MFKWPHQAPFALFLSHDVDTIYERNFWSLAGCLKRFELVRLCNRILSSKSPLAGVEEILHIEDYYGYKSTFFLLEDNHFSHYAGRYRYCDAAVRELAALVIKQHDEVALHGAYFAYNDATKYGRQNNSFQKNFGKKAVGIRNHYLHCNGTETWLAQAKAGFKYDSTFGERDRIASAEYPVLPFCPLEDYPDFVEIPITVMDVSLFQETAGWTREKRLTYCQDCLARVIGQGGVVTLNFHNNYFADEYYHEFQELYEELLAWLAPQKPWNGTGSEIAEWYLKNKDNP